MASLRFWQTSSSLPRSAIASALFNCCPASRRSILSCQSAVCSLRACNVSETTVRLDFVSSYAFAGLLHLAEGSHSAASKYRTVIAHGDCQLVIGGYIAQVTLPKGCGPKVETWRQDSATERVGARGVSGHCLLSDEM